MRGEPVVTARVNWLMGEQHLEPGLELRRRPRALRGRDQRRPVDPDHVPRPPPGIGRRRPRPQSRHRRDGAALRERDPGGVRGRAGHPDLSRPAGLSRARGAPPAPERTRDPRSLQADGPRRDRDGRGQGDRTRHRARLRRGGRARGVRRAHARRHRGHRRERARARAPRAGGRVRRDEERVARARWWPRRSPSSRASICS